jgi:nucleotide-binding universal stress UspA family protein
MMNRILVAVDDSPPSMRAAAAATELAGEQGAELHFVAVSEPSTDADQALNHVAALADAAGVPSRTTLTDGGHAFEVLLSIAHDWGADLIVMGRSDNRRPGVPYIGSQTEHLLEFTDIPVLVVPYPPRGV